MVSGAQSGPGEFAGLRRQPRQARSRARVHAIRSTAQRIIGSSGVEALTIRALADEAGVAVGTVYQFYDDKAAVLDAVVRHHMDSFDAVLAELRVVAGDLPWAELVELVFDRVIARSLANPAYLAIRAEHQLSPQMQQADEVNIAALADILRAALVHQENLRDTAALAGACRVAVQTAEALLRLAFQEDRRGEPTVLREARRIVHLYLNDIIAGAAKRQARQRPRLSTSD